VEIIKIWVEQWQERAGYTVLCEGLQKP